VNWRSAATMDSSLRGGLFTCPHPDKELKIMFQRFITAMGKSTEENPHDL